MVVVVVVVVDVVVVGVEYLCVTSVVHSSVSSGGSTLQVWHCGGGKVPGKQQLQQHDSEVLLVVYGVSVVVPAVE